MRSAATFTIRTSIPIWNTKSASIRSMSMPVRRVLRVMREEGYPLEGFLRQVAFREEDRCRHCYRLRLVRTAQIAKSGGFSAFTTTLLYSRFQKHDLIRSIGEEVAGEYDIPFLYRDFREGWSEGVRISKALGLYRQPYCGCIYSEKERYCRTRGSEEGEDRFKV